MMFLKTFLGKFSYNAVKAQLAWAVAEPIKILMKKFFAACRPAWKVQVFGSDQIKCRKIVKLHRSVLSFTSLHDLLEGDLKNF